MSLRITENDGTFFINGNLNSVTAKSFREHLQILLKKHDEVFIDIDNIVSIDEVGTEAIKKLFDFSLHYNKGFYIAGEGCKGIYHNFNYNSVA